MAWTCRAKLARTPSTKATEVTVRTSFLKLWSSAVAIHQSKDIHDVVDILVASKSRRETTLIIACALILDGIVNGDRIFVVVRFDLIVVCAVDIR
jgi:hypothetical protein